MNKNKKIIILSSSLAGVGLAAGALAASCNDSVKATTADLQNEGKNIQITAVPVVNSGTDYTDQFIVNYGPKTGKLNSNYKYDVQSTVKGEYDQEKSAYNYTAKVLISATNSDGTKVSAVVDVPFMGPTFDANSPYNPLNLKSAKADALQKIDEMVSLSDSEKEAFKLEINEATSTMQVDSIMKKAKLAADKEASEIEALNNAKTEAKAKLNTLEYLSDEEKTDFNGKISQAQSVDAVETVVLNAESLNRANKAKDDAQKAKDKAEADALKAKEDLKQTLMDSTGLELIYRGDKANTYLPEVLSTTKGKLDVKNSLLASLPANLDEIATFSVSSVEVSESAKDVLVVNYRLQSKIDPSVSVTKQYTISGFETEEKYNEMMASEFSKEFDAAVAQIKTQVEFDYTSKETTKTTQATKENVVVTNGEVAPAMVEVESVVPQDPNNYKNRNVVVTYKIVSTNEMYPLSTESMEVVVSGFADNTAEHVANYNLVRNAATDLKLVPVTQTATNSSAPSSAAEANGIYATTHNYMDIFTMNYLENDGKDYVFADNSTRDKTQQYEGILRTYEGVEINVVKVYMLATHPNVLLVDLSLTKDGATANITKTVMGYTKYVAPVNPTQPTEPAKPATPVEKQTEAERLATLKVAATPHYSSNDETYYVQKTFNAISKDIQVLPTTFVTEFNAEVAKYNETEENGYNYTVDTSILNLALENATTADAKIVGVTLTPNNADGTISVNVTLESTKPEYAGQHIQATVSTEFNHKFMNSAIAEAIQNVTGSEMSFYTLPKSVDPNDGTVVQFIKDGMNAAPITDKSVFEGSDASDYYKYFQLKKGIQFVSQAQDGTGNETEVDGSEVYAKVNGDETINNLVKAQDASQSSLDLTNLGLKYRATYVKPDYDTTADDQSDVYVTNKVAIDVPGLGNEAQFVLGGLERKQRVVGFLYAEKIQELYNLWIANSGAFLNQTDTSTLPISYFVNNKDSKATTSVSEASANTPENRARWEFVNTPQTGILYPTQITLADGTQVDVKKGDKFTDPYYVNFGYELDVQSLEANQYVPTGVNINFKVKSPYNDWVSLEDQNTLVNGFQSDLANAQAKFTKLRDLLEADLHGDQKLISVDYIDPANPDAKQDTPVDTAVDSTHKGFFTVLWNKSISPEYFNKVVQEYAAANSSANYDMLLNYDYDTVNFALVSAEVKDPAKGIAAVVFKPSREKEINGQVQQLTAADFTAADVPGFLLTKEQEKARLNELKVQLQYMPAGYVSTASLDAEPSDYDTSSLEADVAASFKALRQIAVTTVTNASDFSSIANYVPERANLVVESVAAAADTDDNRDVKVTVHFVSTSKGLTDVVSDSFEVTFGGFKSKAEATKEQRQAELDAMNVTYSYEVPENTPDRDAKLADKVTPSQAVTDEYKPFFVPSMDQEAADAANVTIAIKSIAEPTFTENEKYNKAMNDKVVVTYTITDKNDSSVSVERTVEVPGFLSAFNAETAKLQAAATEATSDSTKLTLDLANAGQFLPSVAKAVLFNPAYYANSTATKPTLNVADSSAKYKVADVVNAETFANTKFVANNAKGTLAIPFKLVSTDDQFVGLKDADGNDVIPWASGVYTSDAFMKQSVYDPMYEAEVTRLNSIAAKTALTKGNAIGLTIPGIMKKPTVNDVLENKNNIWDDFVLVNGIALQLTNGTFADTPYPGTADTDQSAKVKVRVLSAEKGFKPNSIILTFSLISDDSSKAGMMDYSKVSEYSGVTSKQYTSETILYNFQPEEFKNAYANNLVEGLANALSRTNKNWMEDQNLTQESRNLMKVVKQPVNYYNNTFEQGVENDRYVLDEILKPDSTLNVKLDLLGKDGKLHSPSATGYDLTWKEVANTDSLSFTLDPTSPLTISLYGEGYYIKSSRVVNADISDYLGNYNNSTDLYAVITLGNRFADALGVEVASPEVLVKVSNLLSPAERQKKVEADKQLKLKRLAEATYVANTSNVVLTTEGKEQISSAVLSDNEKLSKLLKVSLLGTAQLNNKDVWNDAAEVQKQYNVNSWAKVNELSDKDAKDAYVKANKDELQLPGLLSTIHNKVNSFLNDKSDASAVVFTQTNDNVNFVVDGTEILSEDNFQVSFIVNYTVQILDENYNVVQSIPTRTMFLNVEKASIVESDKEFKAALASATATFSADQTDLTDEQEVPAFKTTPNISLAEINLPAEYAQFKDDLTAKITKVENASEYDGRVLVEYQIVPKATEGRYASSLFTANPVTQVAWVSGYEYNENDTTGLATATSAESSKPAPAANTNSQPADSNNGSSTSAPAGNTGSQPSDTSSSSAGSDSSTAQPADSNAGSTSGN